MSLRKPIFERWIQRAGNNRIDVTNAENKQDKRKFTKLYLS